MQIVSIGDNLHEMSSPVFCGEKKKKYFSMSSVENFTQHAKPLIRKKKQKKQQQQKKKKKKAFS